MMGDDLYIREVDEYSEETHSDDLFQKSKTGAKSDLDRSKTIKIGLNSAPPSKLVATENLD